MNRGSLGVGKILCVDCVNVNVLVMIWDYRFARNDRRGNWIKGTRDLCISSNACKSTIISK